MQLELWLMRVWRWMLPAGGGSWGHLTLTSQMLMPPSIPVVQNCEQLAFPPASTEIWLGGTKRQRGGGQPGALGAARTTPNPPRNPPGQDRSTTRG